MRSVTSLSAIFDLETRIEKLQDEKLEALRLAKEATGVAKTEHLDKFLRLNKEQEGLEETLAKLDD
jgi:hypothetical protein